MKDTNNFQTSTAEMVTISRAEYEAQQVRIAELEQQVAVLMEDSAGSGGLPDTRV